MKYLQGIFWNKSENRTETDLCYCACKLLLNKKNKIFSKPKYICQMFIMTLH